MPFEPIKEQGNVLENYADFLLNFAKIFETNNSMTDRTIEIIKKYEIGGVIFNSVYGCKSLTPSVRFMKDKLQKIDVPMLDISFQNLDENIGQLKTRVGAFIEILKSKEK